MWKLWNLHLHLPKVWIVIIVIDGFYLGLVVVIFIDISITVMLLVTPLLFILLITLWTLLLLRLIVIWRRVGHNWMRRPIPRMEMSSFFQIHLLFFYYILRFPLIILTKTHQPFNKLPYFILILLCIYPTIIFYLIIAHT